MARRRRGSSTSGSNVDVSNVVRRDQDSTSSSNDVEDDAPKSTGWVNSPLLGSIGSWMYMLLVMMLMILAGYALLAVMFVIALRVIIALQGVLLTSDQSIDPSFS